MRFGAEAAYRAAGNKAALAALLTKRGEPITQQAVGKWERTGIPPKRVPIVSQLTGIPRSVLRPDLYSD